MGTLSFLCVYFAFLDGLFDVASSSTTFPVMSLANFWNRMWFRFFVRMSATIFVVGQY